MTRESDKLSKGAHDNVTAKPSNVSDSSTRIESDIRGRPPDERRQVRQARARPLLQSLRGWPELPDDAVAQVRYDSGGYALTLWDALMRYCGDGALGLDSNAADAATPLLLPEQTVTY